MQPNLQFLEDLARGAGEILRGGFNLRPGYGRQISVEFKSQIDLVTEMDHESEAYLLGEIGKNFPDHGFAAEETGLSQVSAEDQWFVDPLDGTVNYAHGIPIYAVSLAYAHKGVVEHGVVYDPARDEMFTARRGGGAFLNGEPIRPSATAELLNALLVTGFPYEVHTNPENNLDHYARFVLRSQAVRRLGSAAIDLCYVASGRFDGYWEIRINPWDIAAGALIVQEAGGVVTNRWGEADFLQGQPSVVAANLGLHPKMLACLLEGRQK